MDTKLNEILLEGTVQENQDYILTQIPELKYCVGFEHKHPHHHLDVWGHTLEVVRNINSRDLETRMAALLHDIGKPFSYQDEEIRHFHGHPKVSAEMTEEILRRLGYQEDFIENVTYLVREHDTIIDVDNLDNSYNMIKKRLELQYADARAHTPSKVEKRVKFLDEISKSLDEKYEEQDR